nr:energy transducer TonB [uncultured Roseateles sp.]
MPKAFIKLLALLLTVFALPVIASEPWPEPVVTIEQMRMMKRMKISTVVAGSNRDVTAPVVMRVHVAEDGTVRRAVLIESCGSPDHDEASLYAMRKMKFAPKLIDGKPADVTLVVPLHLPLTRKNG